jgi:RHH-type rel operon transcriptional repressor/antitoxin RelB
MSTVMSIRLPDEIKTRLDQLSEHTGRPGAFYVRRAVEEYLEDLEDTYAADEAYREWESDHQATRTWDEFKADLGL